jgi:class 3 adenylate cyclase/GNAT superfamily N-acetyltransferase/ketosteroid isomerase-like protein
VNCTSCGRENRAGARFCGGCGASLAPRCAACGATNEPGARFCDACGAALGAAPARPADDSVARKVVTIVFADLIGSTALHERLDPESVSRVMEAYHAAVRVPIEAHGGTVVQLLGDGVMCAFGVPQVAEDDALRAVRAGVAVQESFRAFLAERPELAGKVGLRVAVNTGEVVVSDDYAAGIGDPLNVAARLQQEARDGDVLLGESTQRHVREQVTLAQVGSFALKGRAEPVAAWRVVSLERPAGAAAVPFVGREDELRRLQAVYDTATSGAAPAARLAVLLGSPGLGKSRLVAEWSGRLEGRATLLSARCESGRGATFAPLAAALREGLGARGDPEAQIEARLPADEPERPRIAAGIAALLAGEPALPQETFFVVRRLLAALAKTRPVLLMIDDLHWAEPLLLDLVEHLVQWGAGVPLVVLAAARPELRALRSSLATPGPLASDVVTLAGLDAAAATRLAARVIGADALPAAIAGRVLAASEGNPLFLAELVRMLVDDGVLRREGEQWVAADAIADFPMPPSIQALLAARIERLAPEERTLLERAAIVGRRFSRSALAALLPREVGDLDARLEALRRSELIEPDTGWMLGEPALRFHHALIRDAAYRRVLKHTRAELHARIASWIEERAGEAVEHDETIGWHWEQAHQNLRELGPLDERGREFGARAAHHLGAAGQRALARDDLPLAAGLLGRALERLAPESPARVELLLDHCEALLATGEVTAATQAVAELERRASGSVRLRAWHTCFAGQLAALTDPDALRATAEAAAAAAEALAAAGDAAGEAKAHSVHAGALARLGAIGASEAALDRALAAARRAHDRRRANTVLAGAPLAALFGPSPVTRASGRCLDVVRVLRITQGAPAVEAVALRCQAVLEALRGRLDAARRMVAASRRLVEELGIGQQLLESDVCAGQIEWLAGDAVAAEHWLRDAYTGLRQRGLRIDAARAAAQLGRILLAQGRASEAEALSHESEALAGDDLQAAIAWRGVRAEALAQRGEHAPAVALAKSAVEVASATDALLHHADAHLALAAVLRAAGNEAEADAEEARAVELWDAKGATLLAERARRERRPPPAERAPEARPERPRLARRVRANAATALCDRMSALIAARDADALPALVSDEMEVVHEPTRSVYGREEVLRVWRSLIEAPEGRLAIEPLASLGDSLALFRHLTTASSAKGKSFDFGAYEVEHLLLAEVDAYGRQLRGEFSEVNRLGHAVARLYERHAELLPEGPERHRAEATARSVARWLKVEDGGIAAAVSPAVEFADRRPLGMGSARGADPFLRGHRAQYDLARDISFRIEDVVALEPSAFLLQSTTSGVERDGGGAFERPLLLLGVFGPNGLVTRIEWFDPDHPTEALARFDELANSPGARRRRVQPNAATANAARFDAAFAARDADALESTVAPGAQSFHHPTGASYDTARMLGIWCLLSEAAGSRFVHEPLATLGESLALFHDSIWYEPPPGDPAAPGSMAWEEIVLMEVDAEGRARHFEMFAEHHLADALARLHQRYAELLPDGAQRERAAATARAVARSFEPPERGALGDFLAAHVELVDHRAAGLPPTRGLEGVAAALAAAGEVGDDLADRCNDVLALEPAALLMRWVTTGRARVGGGAFGWPHLRLTHFGADGLVDRVEVFGPEQERAALARFEELIAIASFAPRIENAATRASGRVYAAWAARDWEAFAALYAPGYRIVDRQRLVQLESERDAWLASYRRIFEMGSSRLTQQVLATRGERLALIRVGWQGTDHSIGQSEIDWLLVVEVDDRGELAAQTVFDADALDAAYAELDARYDVAEATPYAPALSWRRRLGNTVEQLASLLAPDFTVEDHSPLGWGTLDAPAYHESLRALAALAPDARVRTDHLWLSDRGALGIHVVVGTHDGGTFEQPRVTVSEVDAQGRERRRDIFTLAQLDTARARFAELLRPASSWRSGNAATRAAERFGEAWRALDIERFAALLAPAFRNVDRRRIVATDLDRDRFLASFRPILARATHVDITSEVLATRGDRLALLRTCAEVTEAETGPSEIAFLQIFEVDAQGRIAAGVGFDPDALDAATAELDERYGGPRAPTLFLRGVAAQDWDAVAALLAPDLLVHDHRPLGWETLRGPAAYLASLRALTELSPDARLYADHAESAARGVLGVTTLLGTREGGAFELRRVVVMEVDSRECIRRIDFYDLDQLGAARQRFSELTATPRAAPRVDTLAMRTGRQLVAALEVLDWERIAAFYAPGFRSIDRQRTVQLESEAADYLEAFRQLVETFTPPTVVAGEELATRGERLALANVRWTGSGASVGPSELAYLELLEVDDAGKLVLEVAFDPGDLDAAFAELDRRYFAGEAAAHPQVAKTMQAFLAAFASRDWEALGALFAADVEVRDRRRLGWEPIRGRAAYVASLRSLVELAPDAHLRLDHVKLSARGVLWVASWVGTREGGAFEAPWIIVSEHDAEGVVQRFDQYDVDHLDAARSRFEALRPDPLRIPLNAATRLSERLHATFATHDAESFEALIAPGFRLDDRRRGVRLSGDRETFLASARLIRSAGSRPVRTVLATAGERLALEHKLWRDEKLGTEVETLDVTEIDAEGRLLASVVFDPDDRRAAAEELFVRYRRGEGARHVSPAFVEFVLAMNAHDAAGARALLPDDFVFHDHRRTGLGRLGNADDYVAALTALWEQSSDVSAETLYYFADAAHASLNVGRLFGTLAEGGEFESPFVRLARFSGGRFVGAELFELEDLERARARFEALRPDPLRIPPNAASRAMARVADAFRASDWRALRAVANPEFRFEDRRKHVLVSGDIELYIRNLEVVRGYPGLRTASELLATAGDRIQLERIHYRGEQEGGAFEGEFLRLCEVDAEARLRAVLHFDSEDRAAAFAETHARFAAGEAAAHPVQAPISALVGAVGRHDWLGVRACFTDDATVQDHRSLGLGALDADGWVDSLGAMVAPDLRTEPLRILAWGRRGRVSLMRLCGTREGGPFENVLVVAALTRGDRIARYEFFDVADAERALARLEEPELANAAGYTVERARAEDLPKLAHVELAANTLFEGTAVAAAVAGDVTGLDELSHAHAAGLLWVARAPDGEPVGFALAEIIDGQPHVEEIDVDPAHGRRGLGRALLEAVLGWARGAGFGALTLTTFRDFPWNTPFYERMGFRALAPHEIGPGLAEVVREEAARGLDPATRVTMRRALDERP